MENKDLNKILIIIMSISLIGMFLVTSINTIRFTEKIMELDRDVKYTRSIAGMLEKNMFNDTHINGSVGKYFVSSSNIALYTKGQFPTKVLKDAQHETGHYIWYEFLDENDFIEYEQIFNSSDEFVSEYAKTEVYEDFAETFMELIDIEINFSNIPEDRREFFEKKVKMFLQ